MTDPRNSAPCGCDGRGQVHHEHGALAFVTLCPDAGCAARLDAEFMGEAADPPAADPPAVAGRHPRSS